MAPTNPTTGEPDRTVEFVRLFTAITRQLYAYILVLLPDEDVANDVFQEVSVVLWERFDQFEQGTNFYAWAKQIAYYKVLQHRDRHRHRIVYLGEGVLEQLAESLHDSETSLEEQFRALGDCLARMPLPDRELLSRRYAPQATTAQVAADTGCSIHQMYRQLRRLHRALFDCVTKALSGREELQ